MKNSISRAKVVLITIVAAIILLGISIIIGNINFPGDIVDGWYSKWNWVHISAMYLSIISFIFLFVILIWDGIEMGDSGILRYFYKDYKASEEESTFKATPIKFKRTIFWIVVIIIIIYLFNMGKSVFNGCATVYNKSKMYTNTYIQKVQEKKGFYDKLWKTYLQKEKITAINKETFIQVTKIIMENRKDGEKITWKWLQENQQISYDEFTAFYADLSTFIQTQREGYFNIEKECQLLANKNNTLLDTFPNNLYNKILGCEKINFEYGMLSDSTENVFTTKKENLK